ncbi:MAG TPA: hypothetical protein VIL33_04305, partial [Rhodothermia bacterium]
GSRPGFRPHVMGELIAIGGDSMYVLTDAEFHSIPLQDIEAARLFYFDPKVSQHGVWVTLGFFSTLSHGFFLALTAPVWLIAGSAMVGARSREPLVRYKSSRDSGKAEVVWREIAMYARFPQGLPDGAGRPLR